jgi:hypothetical protein
MAEGDQGAASGVDKTTTVLWLSSLVALAGPAVAALEKFTSLAEGIPKFIKAFSALSWTAATIFTSAFLIMAFCAWRKLAGRPSALVDRDILILRPDNPAHFRGRPKETIEELRQICTTGPVTHLWGEAGVGKTALIRAGLIPEIKKIEDVLPVYLDCSRVDWNSRLVLELSQALWNALSAPQRTALALKSAPQPNGLQEAIEWVPEKLHTIPLLIFDHFNVYQKRYQARLQPTEKGRWLAANELAAVNPFWEMVRSLVASGRARCLFVTRGQSGWTSFQFGPITQFLLGRLTPGLVRPFLAELTEKGVSNPENGWTDLIVRLANDLERDGSVLPYQMMMAFNGSSKLRSLTVAAYDDNGGLIGLEARHLDEVVTLATIHVGRPSAKLAILEVLQHLIGDAGKTPLKAERELQDASMPAASLKDALEFLWAKKIVRRFSLEDEAGRDIDTVEGRRWSLENPHLGEVVIEALERAKAKKDPCIALLEASNDAYDKAGWNPWKKWWTLLGPRRQIELAYSRWIHGKFHYGQFARYAQFSMLRLLEPVVLVALVWLGGTLAFQKGVVERRDTYRIQQLFRVDSTIVSAAAKSVEEYAPEAMAEWAVGKALYDGVERALEAIDVVGEYEGGADPRVAIARAMMSRGRTEDAKLSWKRAEQAARAITDVDRKCLALADLACHMAAASEVKATASQLASEAVNTAEKEARDKKNTLPALLAAKALVMVRVNQVNEAADFWRKALEEGIPVGAYSV